MPTTRMIDPLIWKSESMAKLTLRQRLLFIGLFSNADDQGRCRAHPALVRSNVFPYDEIAADEIAADLKAIEDIESIKLYTDKNIPVLQILNWWKYQHPQWAYPSNIAPLDGWHDRLRYRKGERQVVTVNWDGELPNQLPNQLPSDLPGAIELGLEVALGVEVEKPIGANAPAQVQPPPQKPKGKEGAERPHDLLFDAIAKVCCIDPKVRGNGAKIGKARAALADSEPPYSPDEIIAFGTWWNADEWRRKKGPPTVWKLTEQIGIVRNGNGKESDAAHKPNRQYTQADIESAERINKRRSEQREAGRVSV